MNMTTNAPFALRTFAGNQAGASIGWGGRVLADPPHVFSPEGLQDSLRASWWAPAFANGAAATVLPDQAYVINPPYTVPSPQFDLTPHGTPTVSFSSKWDRAVTLNGTTDYFDTADHADLRIGTSQAVTFVAWVFVNGVSPQTWPVFSKQSAEIGSAGYEYELSIRAGNFPLFQLVRPDGQSFYVSGLSAVPVGQWTMLRCYYDPTRQKVGLAVGAGAANERGPDVARTYTAGATFQIGAASALGRFFPGRIDEVTRWNRLLTIEEVEWLLQNDLWNGALLVFKAASGNPILDDVVETDPGDTPTALTLTVDVGNQVDLAWCINAVGLNWHQVYRSIDGGASEWLANVPYGQPYYHDSTADTSAHAYVYKVRAANFFGFSAFSDEVHSTGFVDPEGGNFVDPETGGNFQDPETT